MVNIQILKDELQTGIIWTSNKTERRFSQRSKNLDPKLQLLKSMRARLMAWSMLPVAASLSI